MKKLMVLLLTTVLVFSFLGGAGNTIVTAAETGEGVALNINGELKTMVAYNIKYNNYFKLRDIANILKGTEAQFDVIWNSDLGAIELISGKAYSTDEEITKDVIKNPVAVSSYVPIYKDGNTVLLTAYNIADNNYFKLRDVASAIGFSVDWDSVNSVIKINTGEKYTYPSSDSFGLNTRYLTYLGKSKAEVDAMHNSVGYSYEFGMTTYDNGLMMGWGKLGEEPLDTDCAVSMYVPLRLLFNNCPWTLTKDQVKNAFNSSFEDYDMMDEQNVICVNYCGKILFFYPDGGLFADNYAFINVYNDYPDPATEYIQITNSQETEDAAEQGSNVYYDYAVLHDAEFWSVNQHWMDEKTYYYLADPDHDGIDEMVVKIGAGIAVFDVVDGLVQPVFYDALPESSGRDQYWLTNFGNKDYIAYTTASSSEYCVLYKITDRELDSFRYSSVVDSDYRVGGNSVSKSEYDAYKNSITYPVGSTIDILKNANVRVLDVPEVPSGDILGYYYDDETGSNITITYENEKYYITPYIVRNFTDYTELLKIDDYTYKFYDYDNTDWVLYFDEGYNTMKMDHISTSEYRQPDPYWYFKKQV